MNDLKNAIFTTFERTELLTFLDQFDQIIYKSGIDVKSYIKEKVSEKYQSVVNVYLLTESVDSSDTFAKVKELRDQLIGMKAITITLPFQPDEKKTQNICQIARTITKMPVIIEILVDKSLMGGAIIEGDGRIGEYSFRQYFDKKLNHERRQDGF